MTNLCIAYINRADTATLTASPAAGASTPVTYLQNDSRGHLFAASASGSQEIRGEWGGTAYTIGCARLERTNLADGDTWRIELYSDAAWTTQVWDSTVAAPFAADLYDNWPYSVAEKFFTPVAGVKSFKITVVSAAVFQAARLFVGPYAQAEYNPSMINPFWSDPSEQERLDGGSLATLVREKFRAMAFDMDVTTEAGRAVWDEVGLIAGKSRSVIVSAFPGIGGTQERDHSVMGKFEESPSVKLTGYNQYDFSLTINGL